jgi:hypothetical protein
MTWLHTHQTHPQEKVTHCHTREPEHYCRCRQTQYTNGARNRRTHRLAHNSASDAAPRRHGCIHTRHIHKTRPTFQTSSTIPVTKDQLKRLQMPGRTLLLAPTQYTHGAHDRRIHRLAHYSAPDTAPRLHTHWTHPLTIPGMASRPPIGYILPRPLQKTTQSWLHQLDNTCCLPWELRQAQPGPLSCYNRIQNPTGLPPSCKLLRRQYRAPSPQPRQGHP